MLEDKHQDLLEYFGYPLTYVCVVDEGHPDPSCVFDEDYDGPVEDCDCAVELEAEGKCEDDCKHWKKIQRAEGAPDLQSPDGFFFLWRVAEKKTWWPDFLSWVTGGKEVKDPRTALVWTSLVDPDSLCNNLHAFLQERELIL